MGEITSQNVTASEGLLNPDNLAPSTSKETEDLISSQLNMPKSTLKKSASQVKMIGKATGSTKQGKPGDEDVEGLRRALNKLKKKNDSYSSRLKKALNLSENKTFMGCLKKFTTLAALFTVMQFREVKKQKMGRRFTKDEKIMALSIYKQGPKAYRWLSKIFILPSPLTLSRLIGQAGIKPGVNKNIFSQLKKRVQKMKDDEKLCILLFDEVKINPHFDYNSRNDKITGFAGIKQKNKIADHALVFMIRGVMRNYKQPIGYSFCKGTTPMAELKEHIKEMVTELQKAGFIVIATVCDQGTTNVSTINKLVEETKVDYRRKNKEMKHRIFEINGQEIIPLYDAPHLIKCIRNNLLTKKLTCIIENESKTADWNHIIQLHAEDPAYKGIKIIKNLTESHVNPRNMKMKVKYATQIFSRTVASNMGYLADKGILPKECKETADVILFFDDLFDSMNGIYRNSQIRNGKMLLQAVTPNSKHSVVWTNAKKILQSMKFVTKNQKVGTVPSITNWLVTLENIEYLKDKLFNVYNIKSFWMRHFNQDLLENFFGCIRSHGSRIKLADSWPKGTCNCELQL